MELPEELYCVMMEVGYCAKHQNNPGPLAQTMIGTAKRSLDLWHKDPTSAHWYSAIILSGVINLRATTAQMNPLTCRACWRISRLLKNIADG